MEYVYSDDFLEIYETSMISDVDLKTITRLYQPLIGFKAAMLYISLFNISKLYEGDIMKHEDLFTMMQIVPGDFIQARKSLEAVGLIKTFLENEGDIKKYAYALYAPKSPNDFFNDVLFKGMLVKYIGEKEATKLAMHYKVNFDTTSLKDVSASFVEVFNPNFNDKAFNSKLPTNLKGSVVGVVDTVFDFANFFAYLHDNGKISRTSFDEKEIKEIERIATLYGLDEMTMGDLVSEAYLPNNSKGNRIDFELVTNRALEEAKFPFLQKKKKSSKVEKSASGDTMIAKKIQMFEEISPKQYLSIKQNNTMPAASDLKLIDDISKGFQLNNGVINALIDYVLDTQDNRLTRAYVEKVAASLAREGVENVVDAMNFLNKKSKKKDVHSKVEAKKEESTKSSSSDDVDYDELIKQIVGD